MHRSWCAGVSWPRCAGSVRRDSMTLNDKLAAYFQAHEGQWIDGRQLATIGGSYGWRTRCSDLRKRGLIIENRQRRMTAGDGSRWVLSEYRMVAPKGQLVLSI